MLEKIFLFAAILLTITTNAKLRHRARSRLRHGGPCNAEWCDPSHEPYPNIVSVMTGYDIIKGNPFPSDERNDPGFSTSYIFVPTYKTKEGRYALHGGISVRKTFQCSLSLDTTFITTVKGYIDSISSAASNDYSFTSNLETEVSAEVKGVGISTTVPPLFDAAFGSSSEESESSSFFEKKQGVLSLTDATCHTYTVHISSYDPPPFTDAMVNALHRLNDVSKKSDHKTQEQEVAMFIHQFGTHFLEKVTMGARLSMSQKYSRKEFAESNKENIKECNKQRFAANIFGAQIGAGDKRCEKVSHSSTSGQVEGFKRIHIVSYGSHPATDMVKWSQQKFEAPLPIQMKLSPIINLFTKAHFFKRHDDINYKAILKMMIPYYYRYCATGKTAFGEGKCSIKDRKGCGWNDDCKRNQEVCIDKKSNPKGYTCCKPQCALLKPCQNGGSCTDVISPNSCSYKCKCKSGYVGARCTDKLAYGKTIEKEARYQLKYYKRLNHQDMANHMVNYFKKKYNLYWFTAISYNEVGGFDKHTISCYSCIHVFREYGRNFVMGWAKKTSRIPSTSIRNRAAAAAGVTHRRGCDAHANNKISRDRISAFGYPLSFVFTCKRSGGCDPRVSTSGYMVNKKYICCIKYNFWNKRRDDHTYVTAMFGSA